MRKKKLSYGKDIKMREYDAEASAKRTRLASGYLKHSTETGVTREAAKEGSMAWKLRLGAYPSAGDAAGALADGATRDSRLCGVLDEVIGKEVRFLERRDEGKKV